MDQCSSEESQKLDQLIDMWKWPPPISYDGKTTWMRTAPAIERDLETIIQQNKDIRKSMYLDGTIEILLVVVVLLFWRKM